MRNKRLLAAAMTLGLAFSTMPAAAWAEETTEAETVAETEEGTVESEAETEEAFDYSSAYDDNGYFTGIKALDYVTLPDYKDGFEVPENEVIPSDDAIQSSIENDLSSYMTENQVTDRAVEDGDTVNIDYVGSVDGVEFKGGNTNGSGTEVTIGVTNYIDDFLDQLVGHMPGETFDVEVTFPDPYKANTDLSGKDAVFKTTINYIVSSVAPELNDEFVKENLEFDTADEYRQSVYDKLYQSNLDNAVLNWLVNNAEVSEVPDEATDAIYGAQYNYLQTMCGYYGMTVEDYLSAAGSTTDGLREQCRAYAEQTLILQAVMEDAGLEITTEMAKEMTGADDDTYAQFLDFYGQGYIFNSTIPNCVCEYLGGLATLAETEEETGTDAADTESETVSEEETTEETESAAE